MSVIQSSQHTNSLTTILHRPSCQLTVRVCSEYRQRRHRRASICRVSSCKPSCELAPSVCLPHELCTPLLTAAPYRQTNVVLHEAEGICYQLHKLLQAESGFTNSSSWDSRLPKKQKQVLRSHKPECITRIAFKCQQDRTDQHTTVLVMSLQVVTLLTTDGFVTLPSWSEFVEVSHSFIETKQT